MSKPLKPIHVRRTVDVVVSPQAQKILASTKYTVSDFIDWALETQKISFGGHNVTVFLERKYNDEDNIN